MWKFVLMFIAITFLSCETSKKGAWSEKDKKDFLEGCKEEILNLKGSKVEQRLKEAGLTLEDFIQDYCNCGLKADEARYENPAEALKDTANTNKEVDECFEKFMKRLENFSK